MIPATEHSRQPPGSRPACEECQRRFEAAARELGAFITASTEVFGTEGGATAVAVWLDLAETITMPKSGGRNVWRAVTIAAAGRFADSFLAAASVRALEKVGPS